MRNGYIVNDRIEIDNLGTTTLREAAHASLDKLLDQVACQGGVRKATCRTGVKVSPNDGGG